MMTTVTSDMVGVMTTTKLTSVGRWREWRGNLCYEKMNKKSETMMLGNVLISLYLDFVAYFGKLVHATSSDNVTPQQAPQLSSHIYILCSNEIAAT